MQHIHAAEPSGSFTHLSARLGRLERSNARWRAGVVVLAAALGGLVVGGMGGQPAVTDYDYAATDDTIYRIDAQGQIEYIRLENGVRSAEGYFGWGLMRIDPERAYSPKP